MKAGILMAAEWTGPAMDRVVFDSSLDEYGVFLEFRLFYDGPLSSGQGKGLPKEKHAIRKQLHPQLRALWSQTKYLKDYAKSPSAHGSSITAIEFIGNRFRQGNNRYVPLITEASELWCSLDVLFLRRDVPGNLVGPYGDMDNRLKVLFDALAVPGTTDGIPETPEPDDDPMYCLLEDDRLITSLSVTTDRLLTPLKFGQESLADVKLVIHVATRSFTVPPVISFLGE